MDHKILFYVVQFLDLPFKKIYEYVCVPSSWVISQNSTQANVTYPNNENPSVTRGRVIRRENPNDDWRLYRALIKHKSENYMNAKRWISRNSYHKCNEESGIKDTPQKLKQNRKPHGEIQPCSSGSNSDQPELTPTDSNPRKLLKVFDSKISMRQLLLQKHYEILKRLHENSEHGIVTDRITAASSCPKQEQSIIITGNQVIQTDQMKTSFDSNGKANIDQNTQSAVVKENQSVKMSIQSISSKLLAKQQLLHETRTEQQQSRQPPTEQQQSRQSPPERQPSPKLMAKQHSLSKISDEQQSSRVGEDYQQLYRGSIIDVDEYDEKMDISQNILPEPVTDRGPPTKTPPSTFKPAPQCDLMNKKTTALIHHKHSILEPHSRVLSAGQSKESNDSQESYLHGIPTAVTITALTKPPSTTNETSQQYGRYQLPMSSVSNNLNSKLEPCKSFEKNSVEVPDDQSILRFQNILDSITSASYDDPNLVKLSQMLKLEARKLFPATKELINTIDKKISLEGITKNISTVEHPSKSIRQLILPDDSTDTQSTQRERFYTVMDVDHSVEALAGSTVNESTSKVVKSARQTDEWLRKEKESFCKDKSSDPENPSEHEVELENEVVPEANQTILISGQSPTPENQHVQSRIFIDQDTTDVFITLFTQMGANLAFACDMLDCIRNSILTCAQTHETLLKKVIKFNSIESLQISASPPNGVISQVTPEKSARDKDNATIVGNATTPIREQKGTFSLPVEYDPNDTKWTLKYRENKPGLVELIPQTGVYVKRKELDRCTRKASNCRTLARLLLTEVFSQNALRVCSWTGGKAKALNSVNIDVRPGLDEDARMALLTFVEQHGEKRGWITSNTSAIMSTIMTKMKNIRAKHDQTCKV